MIEPNLLLIETATRTCSVAVSRGENVLAESTSPDENDHAANLTLMIADTLLKAKLELRQLDAIAVSIGPGSYTGLRIGLSTAKGLCFGLSIPLLTIGTLEAFASFSTFDQADIGENDLILAVMDARRMEVFAGIFDARLHAKTAPFAHIVQVDSFSDLTSDHNVHVVGDALQKTFKVLEHNSRFIWHHNFQVSASLLASKASEKFLASDFADLAYSEPFYLKEYIAGAPKVKGLV